MSGRVLAQIWTDNAVITVLLYRRACTVLALGYEPGTSWLFSAQRTPDYAAGAS